MRFAAPELRTNAGKHGYPATSSPSRGRKREQTVWQRLYQEHQIRDERDFELHCDYLHFNPVKHGLVERAADWP